MTPSSINGCRPLGTLIISVGAVFRPAKLGLRWARAKREEDSNAATIACHDGACFAVNAQRLEQIETKIAFLERANAELSDVIFRQHREIETLRAQMAALAARVNAAQSDTRALTPEEERPPHY
jgi:uncharacterized coiled-coil protein SlyX